MILSLTAGQSLPVAFYVSPAGNDSNPGSLSHPFLTLERARDAVRELKRTAGLPIGGVTIRLRGGEYQREVPLVLTHEDSGEAGKPVIYAAYGEEKPVIFGGRRISGFKQKRKEVWQVAIPEAKQSRWVFRTLYVNGKRYTLACSPNKGYYRMAGGVSDATDPTSTGKSKSAFLAPAGTLQDWKDLNGVDVKVFNRWWTSFYTLKQVDTLTGIVQLAEPARWEIPTIDKAPFIVENHPGALDKAGEWQLDRERGILQIIPLDGDDLSEEEVFAPVAEQLVVLAGNTKEQQFAEYIEFRGITFRGTHWTLPPGGFDDIQAAVNVGAVIEGRGARNCVFEGCELSQTDSYGMWFRSGSRDCVVKQCHLHDLGAGGIKLGEAEMEDPDICAGGNRVENCYIHNGGHVHGGAVGVWIGSGSDNVIAHNEISDLWYTGISVGWTWSTNLNGTRNNKITYNHIHDVVQQLDDGGGIYCLGLQPMTVLANNWIHDVGRDGGHADTRGIYLDEGSSAILAENNIIHDTQGAAMRLQIGTNCNIIINNIFAFARRISIDLEVARSNVFINNIVYWDQGRLFRHDNWPNYDKVISKNVYWSTTGNPILFAGLSWEEWRRQHQTPFSWYKGETMDEGSVIADPQFEDASRRDFRLKPGSPALKLGFRPINMKEIGLTGDETWRSLPLRYRMMIPFENE